MDKASLTQITQNSKWGKSNNRARQNDRGGKWVYVGGRRAAKLRNGGMLCDIRRHANGFLYNGRAVAVSQALLDSLADIVTLQFTNLDTGDVWTTTARDFRRMGEAICYAGYEPQRFVWLSRLNHTIDGRQPRHNELRHVDETPLPRYSQPSLFDRVGESGE